MTLMQKIGMGIVKGGSHGWDDDDDINVIDRDGSFYHFHHMGNTVIDTTTGDIGIKAGNLFIEL